MDEPKRWTMVNPLSGVTCKDGTVLRGGVVLYKDDDPAIVQALAVRKACHEAGLLDERGNLRRIIGTLPVTADGAIVGLWGNCYSLEEGDLLECGPIGIRDEDDGCGIIVTLRDVSGYEHERDPQQLFSTRSAAERAAGEHSNGGTDGQ